MTAIDSGHEHIAQRSDPDFVHPEASSTETSLGRAFRYVAAALRISLGWVFLWAFLDKTFGLGHETANADAWINGGEPTRGFLEFGTAGPFADMYKDIAGAGWADWLFMTGLAGIGVALILGVTMRIATAAGVLMLVLVALALIGAGRTIGLGKVWESLPIVASNGWLK